MFVYVCMCLCRTCMCASVPIVGVCVCEHMHACRASVRPCACVQFITGKFCKAKKNLHEKRLSINEEYLTHRLILV